MAANRAACALAIALALVTACATNGNLENGKRLINQGQTEDGLTLLEKAAQEDPRNAETRTLLIRERDLAITDLLALAERERSQGNLAQSETAYGRVLRIDPNQARAKAGLTALQSDFRLKQQLAQAEQQMKQGDLTGADTRVRAILGENPDFPDARSLQRRILERLEAATAAAATTRTASGKPITLEFRDAPIRSVFEMISRTAGINFVFDKDVLPTLRVTIFVRNSPLDDAIKLLLTTNQLERKVINDNSVLIYPNTPAKLKEYQDLVVRSFYLGNADVKQTQLMIKNLVRTRDMFVDEKLNLLIIRDTPDAVRMAEKLIAAQDLAEPEVMLELEVLEVKRSKLQQLGIQYPNQFTVLNIVPAPSTITATGGVVLQSTNATTTTSQLTLDGLRGGPQVGQVAVSPNPSLNLKNESSDVNLLANPRIRVKNREKAKIHIGDRVPVITTTSTANVGVSQSVNYLDIGLKLDVEPNVLLDDDVSIKVGLEVSNIVREISNSSGVLTYQVGTRAAATVLRLKNGETQVLAGLINDEDRRSASGIPGLADIPLIGRLFANRGSDSTKTEIMLLITPRVLRNVARPDLYAAQFPGGTDNAAGVPPLQIRPTASGALSMSGSGGNPLPGGNAAPQITLEAVRAAERAAIRLSGGAQVVAGGDLAIVVALPSIASRAQFDLVYDEGLLTSVVGANARNGPDTGRVTLSYDKSQGGAQMSLQARFKAVGKGPAGAQVAIENMTVTNDAGQSVDVELPPPHKVSITP